jgi:flagellar biosynthetic protein FliP
MNRPRRARVCSIAAMMVTVLTFFSAGAAPLEEPAKQPGGLATPAGVVFGSGAGSGASLFRSSPFESEGQNAGKQLRMLDSRDAVRTVQTVALFGLVSLAPVGVLMLTAFVRINIVLALLRQALGSPQIPGNQVLMALALLLTALVMRPVGERVYNQAIVPYQSGQVSETQAWAAGSKPIKIWMVHQIIKAKHQDYLWSLYRYAEPTSRNQAEPEYEHEFPFRVVAPAYVLSELTTALVMGFYLYLPFLVIDLVVSAVLAAMGLYMLPPTLVSMPIKLIVFVLADGWMLVSLMLLSSFAAGAP